MYLITAVISQPSLLYRINPVVIGAGNTGVCPSSDILESTRQNISEIVQQILTPCRAGWSLVTSLDLGDPSQRCPSPWIETSTPQRSCYVDYSSNCIGLNFPVSGVTSYSHVCGRIEGYAAGTVDGFKRFGSHDGTINGPYLDGISVTHGSPRQHIWSFASGFSSALFRCPCDNPDRDQAPLPPSYVGENYFCDNEENGALWDGMDCTTPCCIFNSPPWFSMTLPAPTSDAIEVRICSDQTYVDEVTNLRSMDIYVK